MVGSVGLEIVANCGGTFGGMTGELVLRADLDTDTSEEDGGGLPTPTAAAVGIVETPSGRVFARRNRIGTGEVVGGLLLPRASLGEVGAGVGL